MILLFYFSLKVCRKDVAGYAFSGAGKTLRATSLPRNSWLGIFRARKR